MCDIKIFFILPNKCEDESQVSDVMLQALEACQSNLKEVTWLKECDVELHDFTENDILIFQDFQGDAFEKLRKSHCARILGPWCLLVCLTEGYQIPKFTWPIYNVAMINCVVSSSYFPKSKKQEIKEKVQLMGGYYSDGLIENNTHLITETVKTFKYSKAAEVNVKIMIPEWIDDVWKISQERNIHCDNEEFQKYLCPPLYNLRICFTGISNTKLREELREMVVKNGAIFTPALVKSSTDVLIVNGVAGSMSDKYKAARNSPNIKCVTLDWMKDSIMKGYALAAEDYVVNKPTSTPTKDDKQGPNFSVISAIDGIQTNITSCEETIISTNSKSYIDSNKRKDSLINDMMNDIDIKKAKLAGQYLDGCSVYLAGFKNEQKEKLYKIVSLSGATRYDDISERITHVIVGDQKSSEIKQIVSKNYPCTLVSFQWLLDCLNNKKLIDEEKYLITTINDSEKEYINSPSSRKALSLLKSTLTEKALQESNLNQTIEQPLEDNYLLQQYLQNSHQEQQQQQHSVGSSINLSKVPEPNSIDVPQSTLTTSTTTITENSNKSSNYLFQGYKFMLLEFNKDDYETYKNYIEEHGGTVVMKSFKGIPGFVVVPIFIRSGIKQTANEIINISWIMESINEYEIKSMCYYHRPFIIENTTILNNCVITITNYKGFEKEFLYKLILELGGVSQDRLARTNLIEKNVLATTHLIGCEAFGKKYEAAIKWGLPVLSKEWLLDCAKLNVIPPLENYLIGDSKITNDRKSNNSKIFRTPLSIKDRSTIYKDNSDKQKSNCNTSNNEFNNSEVITPPVNKIMKEIRDAHLSVGTPETPRLRTILDVSTPSSPIGAFIQENPSPSLKKEILRIINRIPDPPFGLNPRRRLSTPLSEVKRKCYEKMGLKYKDFSNNNEGNCSFEDGISPLNENSNLSQNTLINNNLKQLEDMLNNSNNKNRRSNRFVQQTLPDKAEPLLVKDSQPFTVGWDFSNEETSTHLPKEQSKFQRIFILSGIPNDMRPSLVKKLESLGGIVSDLSTYDPSCTHLICPSPARNEKALSCMAAGKWILHISYINKSIGAGHFLNEEDFEFGNPKSYKNIPSTYDKQTEQKLQALYWWRTEIQRRGYGAFNDMRAIVVANKKDSLERVIEAGGGVIIDAKPPFNDTVNATHCLIECKNVEDFSNYVKLAKQGVYCINTLYISDFLYRNTNNIKDCVLPGFNKYYKD